MITVTFHLVGGGKISIPGFTPEDVSHVRTLFSAARPHGFHMDHFSVKAPDGGAYVINPRLLAAVQFSPES